MDIIVKKQLGYLIAGIWSVWGCAVLAYLLGLEFPILFIIAIEGTWYVIDAFIIFFIHYYCNIELRTPEAMLKQLMVDLKKTIPLVDPEIYEQIRKEINQ